MDSNIQTEIEDEPARRRWLAYGIAVAAVMLVLTLRVIFTPQPSPRLDLFLLAPALLGWPFRGRGRITSSRSSTPSLRR